MPLDWKLVLGSQASRGACVEGSAPCRPPPPPGRAAASAARRRRCCPPPAATGCGRCRAGLAPAGLPPPANSAPPAEPRNHSPACPLTGVGTRADQTSSKNFTASNVSQRLPEFFASTVSCYELNFVL